MISLVSACAHHARPQVAAVCAAPTWSPLSREGSAAAPLVAPWDDHPTVERIVIRGVGEPLASTLRQVIATHPGDRLVDAPLGDDLRRLAELGVIGDARVEVDAGVVAFVVTPRPQIRNVVGADTLALRRLHWLEGAPFEPARVARIAAAIELAYVREGRLDAKVAVRGRTSRSGVELCVAAQPGPKVAIGSIQFPGRRAIPEATLLGAIRGAKAGVNHANGTYDATALEIDRTTALPIPYYERGMILARIDAPQVRRVGAKLEIAIPIDEGPVFRIGRLAIKGGLPVRPRFLASGDVFARSRVAEALTGLTEIVGEHGTVTIVTRLDTTANRIDLTFDVDWRWPWDVYSLWSSASP